MQREQWAELAKRMHAMDGGCLTNMTLSPVEREMLLHLFGIMFRIRCVEEKLSQLFADGEIPGFIHLSNGQEAVPAGVSVHLTAEDTIAITHRGHGHALAKGLPLPKFFAEVLGRDQGSCRGRGGSMHIADASVGMLGANGIVGGGIPIATGSALAHQLDASGSIAVSCFGDGALAEGIFHECLNLSGLWDLPCLFLCENNGWGEFSPSDQQFRGQLSKIATAFDIEYLSVDGSDVLAVTAAAGRVIEHMRSNGKPAVLECHVPRFQGHFEGDPQKYRDEEEKASLRERDPLTSARGCLLGNGLEEAYLAEVETAVSEEIAEALREAYASPLPEFGQALQDVYAEAEHG